MRFVIAGGGVAGLAAALAVARAGHSAVVLERDVVAADDAPDRAFDVPRRGIPHFQQPHAFLPRGRLELQALAPDVLSLLMDAGAEPQDVADKLHGPREPGDEDLVYLWVRRPIIEWALRRAAAAQDGVELRVGTSVDGLLTERGRATGVLAGGEAVTGDVVVDALGRYRTPPGWSRAAGEPTHAGALYYCRYFRLVDGVEHLDWPLLNPRGDLGYMGFNVFRGDNRTYALILLVPERDRELRILRDEATWMAAASAMNPLAQIAAPTHGTPITGVMPIGVMMNVDRTGDPGVDGLVAVGDGFCHTDPAFSLGLAFALIHARALAAAADAGADIAGHYRAAAAPEARERHRLVCATDDARVRHWTQEPQQIARRDGCYPLFAFAAALAAAPHDDAVLRRTIRRVGLLDRISAFDDDGDVHDRIERIFATLPPRQPPGPPRDELLATITR